MGAPPRPALADSTPRAPSPGLAAGGPSVLPPPSEPGGAAANGTAQDAGMAGAAGAAGPKAAAAAAAAGEVPVEGEKKRRRRWLLLLLLLILLLLGGGIGIALALKKKKAPAAAPVPPPPTPIYQSGAWTPQPSISGKHCSCGTWRSCCNTRSGWHSVPASVAACGSPLSSCMPSRNLHGCCPSPPAAKLMGVGSSGGLWRVAPTPAPCNGVCGTGEKQRHAWD